MSFRAYLAAWNPGMPVTPGPGGVEEEHRYTPGSGVRQGTGPSTGRRMMPRRSIRPALKSPPT